jgi:hypothetical protein
MQSSLNVEKIRSDFPIFKNNPDLIFLDNASTTQKPQKVLDTLTHYYENYNSNIHRGIYTIAEKATAAYEESRDKVAAFIGAKDRRSIVFNRGTTESINLVANSWGQNLKSGDEVLAPAICYKVNTLSSPPIKYNGPPIFSTNECRDLIPGLFIGCCSFFSNSINPPMNIRIIIFIIMGEGI